MAAPGLRLHVFPDAEGLAAAVADSIASCAEADVRTRGVFHLVLAGGRTPRRAYETLRAKSVPWQRVHVWFGDERCLPRGSPGRNDAMAAEALLRHVPLPAEQIHPIPAELGPDAAAAAYARELASVPVLDLVLLGLGEDGHTASLFPGHPALRDPRPVVPVHDAPKPPPERVSMGLSLLNSARRRLVMAAGEAKHAAVMRIRRGEDLPAARLAAAEWYVDAAAAGR